METTDERSKKKKMKEEMIMTKIKCQKCGHEFYNTNSLLPPIICPKCKDTDNYTFLNFALAEIEKGM